MIILLVVLTLLWIFLISYSGYSKAVCDVLWFHFETSIFKDRDPQYWNPVISSENKYKSKKWGITTFFVFTTDAWHKYQFLRINLKYLSLFIIALCSILFFNLLIYKLLYLLLGFIINRALFGLSFELNYRKLYTK